MEINPVSAMSESSIGRDLGPESSTSDMETPFVSQFEKMKVRRYQAFPRSRCAVMWLDCECLANARNCFLLTRRLVRPLSGSPREMKEKRTQRSILVLKLLQTVRVRTTLLDMKMKSLRCVSLAFCFFFCDAIVKTGMFSTYAFSGR